MKTRVDFGKLAIVLAVSSSLLVSACATHPDKISAAYVSPMRFANMSCGQLFEEMREIENKIERLTGQQLKKNKQDKWATGVGVVLFWPSLFWLVSDDVKAELQQAKGEYEAVQTAGSRNRCSQENKHRIVPER
jgi:hypothetical protein